MKSPKLLSDLYGDLRDRKLLPLVVVLVAATAAVPLVLASETTPPSAEPDAAAPLPEDMPTAAVLASDPGLRDYRERLDQLRKKNPFAADAPETPDLSESAIQDVTDDEPSGGGGGGLPEISTGALPSAGSGSVTSDTSTSSTGSTSTGGSTGGSSSPPTSGAQWFTYRVDLEVGPAGDTRRRENVKRFEVLPSVSNPVALYLGPAEGGKGAIFLVSEDVLDTRGGGKCRPRPSDCQVLTLREGEEQKLDYAEGGVGDADTFVIEVKRIRIVPIDEPAPIDDRDERLESTGVQAGLAAFFGP